MRIAVAKEIKTHEYRVRLIPSGAAVRGVEKVLDVKTAASEKTA